MEINRAKIKVKIISAGLNSGRPIGISTIQRTMRLSHMSAEQFLINASNCGLLERDVNKPWMFKWIEN